MAQTDVALASAPARPGIGGPLGLVRALLEDKRVRFLLNGGANALMAFGVFVLFQHLFTGRWDYLWAVVATHVVTVLIGFASHRRLVFGVRGQVLHDLWRFELVHLTNLGVNAALLTFAVETLHLPVVLSQGCLIVVSACYSWLGHSRFSFRRSAPRGHE
jgi:putative flippase GtrA